MCDDGQQIKRDGPKSFRQRAVPKKGLFSRENKPSEFKTIASYFLLSL